MSINTPVTIPKGHSQYSLPTERQADGTLRVKAGKYALEGIPAFSIEITPECQFSPNRIAYLLRSMLRLPERFHPLILRNLRVCLGMKQPGGNEPELMGRYSHQDNAVEIFHLPFNDIKGWMKYSVGQYQRSVESARSNGALSESLQKQFKEMFLKPPPILNNPRPIMTHELGHRLDEHIRTKLPPEISARIKEHYEQGVDAVLAEEYRPKEQDTIMPEALQQKQLYQKLTRQLVDIRNQWRALQDRSGPKNSGANDTTAEGKVITDQIPGIISQVPSWIFRTMMDQSYLLCRSEVMAELFNYYIAETVDGANPFTPHVYKKDDRQSMMTQCKPLYNYLSTHVFGNEALLRQLAQGLEPAQP